jgi:hypothetical protein
MNSKKLAQLMAEAPTWTSVRNTIAERAKFSVHVLESARQIDARNRHLARVAIAKAWLCETWIDFVPDLVCEAIEAALACVGAPGSACGSTPPGLFRSHKGAQAWEGAVREALEQRKTNGCGEMPILEVLPDGGIQVTFPNCGQAQFEANDPLCEHVLAVYCRRQARAILAGEECEANVAAHEAWHAQRARRYANMIKERQGL